MDGLIEDTQNYVLSYFSVSSQWESVIWVRKIGVKVPQASVSV